jgi:hypothetical protein
MRGGAARTSILAALVAMVLAGCGPVTGSVSHAGHDSSATPAATTTPRAAGATTAAPPATAPAASTSATVPNVVGMRLSTAESALGDVGLTKVSPVDDTGRGRIVLDPENWVVDAQSPKAGTHWSGKPTVTLQVRRPSDAPAASTKLGVVPDVVCMNLQDAQDTMQRAGFFNLGSADGAGQGRMQILDRDWVVIRQSVPAGTKPGLTKRIVLTSVKYGESTGSSGCKS